MQKPAFVYISSLLAASCGFLLGRVLPLAITSTPLTLQPDERPVIPVVQLEREGSVLQGHVQGEARVIVQGKSVTDTFTITIPGSRGQSASRTVMPEGMQFVASKRGSRYYTVNSIPGQKLAPQNRVYFKTATDAEAAGYTAGN